MTWAIFPRESHYQAVAEILSSASQPSSGPRITAIVGGALLEEAVNRTLRERLRDDPGILGNMFEPDKPLGNVAPKIDMLYLLGVFDNDTRKALKGIASVRNFFAHHLEASFDSLNRDFIKATSRLVLHENKTHYPHHLYGGDSEHGIEPITNKRIQFLVNLKLALIILMRDRVSHVKYSNTPRTEEEIRQTYEPPTAEQDEP